MLKYKNQFFYIMLVLCAGYTVSQFLRTSLGVLSPNLMHDFNINPNNMGLLGGVFFLSFAIFQIPAGILIDKYGPRKVMSSVIIFAVLGSIIFALSNSFYILLIGRVLMGLGCSICLMGSLVLITRWTDSDQFSKLAGIILAVGGIGGLLATTPLSYFSELFGWRLSFWLAAAVTFCVMVLYYFILEDRKNDLILNRSNETISLKNLLFILKERNFKFMIPMSLMSYSSLVVILGLWGAPYLKDIHGLDSVERGKILMLMAISWNIGSFVFGRLRSIFGNYKNVVIFGATGVIILLFILSIITEINSIYLYILFCILGFFGAFSVALISHYQVLFDKEYMGRALSTANFFNFGGVFFVQWLTGKIIYLMGGDSTGAPIEAYRLAFLFVAILLLISLCIYFFSNEKKKSF
ncbi:MAG: MFS transporter [Alphaproteobacteria bacterium]|jgi:MFS family permease|nr:MFS transporter [Alphaproteobacteria bacterium]